MAGMKKTKPHLLLLPGLLSDARLWRHQSSALAEQVQVTVSDVSGADSISGLAAAVLAQAPAERFSLAGLSMGGYVALEIIRQAPERVLALALLDTSAQADTPEATEARQNQMLLAEDEFPAVIAALLPKLLHPAHLWDQELVELVKSMASSLGQDVFMRQQQAMIGRIDSRPFLPQIACPTLVLCGHDDALTPVAVHEELAAAIPGARLVVVDTCGHLSTLEQPRRVSRELKSWLTCLDDPAYDLRNPAL